MMKSFLKGTLALICFALLFVLGVLATFRVNIMIYGADEISDGGPSVAVLMEGLFIGFVLALIGTPLAFYLLDRSRGRRNPAEVSEHSNQDTTPVAEYLKGTKRWPQVTVVIVDRGPYSKNRREGAIIDLSFAAKKSDIISRGRARVKLEVLYWGK